MEREFRCSHCQKELQIQGSLRKRADWYMIKSELWNLVIENNKIPKEKWGHTYLCVDCLEQLLGRKLCLDDLWVKDGREIPANYWLIREVMETDPELAKTRIDNLKKELEYLLLSPFKPKKAIKETRDLIQDLEQLPPL